MEVEELQAAKDFRLEKLAGKPLYFTPADEQARAQMDRLWAELTGNSPAAPVDAGGQGPQARGARRGHGRGALLLRRAVRAAAGDDRLPGAGARVPHHVHRRHSRCCGRAQRDVARRFVNLIDTLYDNRVGLVASAAAEPDAL